MAGSPMHIDLTDHLRCTEPHDEQFLVLLPGTMDGRRVVTGDLGCPYCGRVVRIVAGIADFGAGAPAGGKTVLTAPAIAAFLGLTGPGGFLALVGNATALAPELALLLPGIGIVLVNPPAETPDRAEASVTRAPRLPLKRGSMRGVAVGSDLGADAEWVAQAVAAVLPGLRVVAEGSAPPDSDVEVLAESAECWVGRAPTIAR